MPAAAATASYDGVRVTLLTRLESSWEDGSASRWRDRLPRQVTLLVPGVSFSPTSRLECFGTWGLPGTQHRYMRECAIEDLT
jgi:hypothetical protein